MFERVTPVLHVAGIAAAEAFYCGKLGFERLFAYRVDESHEDPCYIGLQRDEAAFHISSFPGDGVSGAVMNLDVEDLDALHKELTADGVAIELPPTNQTWGVREMHVKDPDGNRLRFVQDIT